jgi:stage II sporulation protein AA (anti-sigma F factor antagonist)
MPLAVSRHDGLEAEIRTSGHAHALVVLDGELDVSSADYLYQQFAELAEEGIKHVALNLAELEFVDSVGLSVIISEHKRVESMGGELIIFSPSDLVRKTLEVSGVDRYLHIRPERTRT